MKITFIILTMFAFTFAAFGQEHKLIQLSVNTGMAESLSPKYKAQIVAGQHTIGLIRSGKYKAEIGILEGSAMVTDVEWIPSTGSFIEILPNPAQDKIILKLSEALNICQISVYNINGISVKSILISGFNQLYEIDISDLPTGIYNLQFSDGRTTYVKGFVKE